MVVSVQRSFLKLKLIKPYLKSIMSQQDKVRTILSIKNDTRIKLKFKNLLILHFQKTIILTSTTVLAY